METIGSDKVSHSEKEGCPLCEHFSDNKNAVPGQRHSTEDQHYFCPKCDDAHGRLQMLQHHGLIDTADMASIVLTQQVTQTQRCSKHLERDVELFCKDLEVLLCSKCTETCHRLCSNDVELKDCVEEFKEKITTLHKQFKTGKEHIQNSKGLFKKNTVSFCSQLDKISEDVQCARDEIVTAVNSLSKHVDERVEKLRTETEERKSNKSRSLDQMLRYADDKLILLTYLERLGTPISVLSELDKSRHELEKFEGSILTESKDQSIDSAELPVLETLRKTADELKTLAADIKVSTQPRSDSVYVPSTRIQTTSKVTVATTEQIRPIHDRSPTFVNMNLHENDFLILCDNYCGYLCLFDLAEKTVLKLEMPLPYCADFIDRNKFVVTIPSTKQITVVTLRLEMKLTQTFTTKSKPRAVLVLKNGTVAVTWVDPVALSFSELGESEIQHLQYLTQDSDGRKFRSFDYLAIYEKRERVIQSCRKDKTVYCFEYSGKPVFKYTHEQLVKPRGVAVDKAKGTVFVCDNSTSTIHSLTESGQPLCVINVDVKRPLAICYDKRKRQWWLSQEAKPLDKVYCLHDASI